MIDRIEEATLSELKEQADEIGLNYHHNIGLDKMRELVKKGLTDLVGEVSTSEAEVLVDKDEEGYVEDPVALAISQLETKGSEMQLRNEQRKKAEKLIRITITCLNPAKKDWEGEIITVRNSVIGSMRKYVPFNNPNGWYVPQFIYNVLKEREYQTFVTRINPDSGRKYKEAQMVNEFAIAVLPELTDKEMQDLKEAQAIKGL